MPFVYALSLEITEEVETEGTEDDGGHEDEEIEEWEKALSAAGWSEKQGSIDENVHAKVLKGLEKMKQIYQKVEEGLDIIYDAIVATPISSVGVVLEFLARPKPKTCTQTDRPRNSGTSVPKPPPISVLLKFQRSKKRAQPLPNQRW